MNGRYTIAVGWVTLGTAIFSLIYASAKFAGSAAMPFQIVLLRYAGGFLVLLPFSFGQSGARSLRSRHRLSHFKRSVTGCFGGAAIIQASASMPVVNATAIGLLSSILAVVFGVLVLKERTRAGHWRAVMLAATGALLIVLEQGAAPMAGQLWPAAVAFAGAVLLAIEAVWIRTLSQLETPLSMLLHVNLFGLGLMFCPALLQWQPLDWPVVMAALSLGPIAITAQYCVIRGYRLAPLSILGPVDYTWLIFAAVLGAFLFDEWPGPVALIGSAMIAWGGMLLVRAPNDRGS